MSIELPNVRLQNLRNFTVQIRHATNFKPQSFLFESFFPPKFSDSLPPKNLLQNGTSAGRSEPNHNRIDPDFIKEHFYKCVELSDI